MKHERIGRMKFLIALATLISSHEVYGHGYMSSPRARPHVTNPEYWTSKNDPVYTLKEGPVFGFSDTAMRCRDRPALDPTTTLVAGGTIDFQLTLPAYHIGDCAFYLVCRLQNLCLPLYQSSKP